MEAKWPFLVITITLLIGIGVLIVSMDRVTVMKQWDTRRCEIPVMFASSFFKPDDDPRTTSAFATANFEFCMKSYVDTFVTTMMAPVQALLGKNVEVSGSIMNSMNVMRTITTTLYNAFAGYLDTFYRRFNASVFEISRVVQTLRMAMRRIGGIVISFIYTGITIFSGMLSSIQFIIKVILIICGIMLLLIIILFFILFPVIPIILVTLAIIVATVLSLGSIMDPSVAADANSKKSGFCFAEWTTMTVVVDNKQVQKSVGDIAIGDQLIDGSRITAVIQMDGTNVELYKVGSVYVSGSHLIKGTDQIWKSVEIDERAIKTDKISSIVYCFNTTSNVITVDGLQFRDWEELGNDDMHGQMIWNYMVSSMINIGKPFAEWKDNLKDYVNIPVMSPNVLVKTPSGFVPIKYITLGDFIIDHNGVSHKVLGLINGEVEYNKADEPSVWTAELYEYTDYVWLKGYSSLCHGVDKIEGQSLITENGEFIILHPMTKLETRVRDFTEVGYDHICKTYPYVSARLRIKE